MKLIASTILSTLAVSSSAIDADAESEAAVDSRRSSTAFHLDLEVDPTAYVFSGYSLHAGIGWKAVRLDLGVYAMDLPALLHGNDGWDASFDGAGAKLQWFPFAEQRGAFIDVSTGARRQEVVLASTGASQRDTVFGIGVDAGWRFTLPYAFYATPWAGLNYDVNAEAIMLDGQTFKKSKLMPFAAIHVGLKFR